MTINRGPSPECGENLIASNLQKLALLRQIYRIVSFDGGEKNNQDGYDTRLGRHGQAYGPLGEATCSVVDSIGYGGCDLFRGSERVHVASLWMNGHAFDFFAVEDSLDTYPRNFLDHDLREALYMLENPSKEYSPNPGEVDSLDEILGFSVQFMGQRLEVYEDLPINPDDRLDYGDFVREEYLSRLVKAIDSGDVVEVEALVNNVPYSLDEETSLTDTVIHDFDALTEISLQKARFLEVALANQYYAVTETS